MRKCPYCAMVSDSNDVCAWCKRPFDSFFDLRVLATNAPAKKTRKKLNPFVQGAALLVLSGLALYSLAMWKTGPDAAKLANSASNPTISAKSPSVSAAKSASGTAPQSSSNLQTPTAAPAASGSKPSDSNQAQSGASSEQAASGPGQAKLLSVHLTTQDDQAGNETAYGTVVISNNSSSDISDFSLTLHVNDSTVQLVPYQGDINYPMALTSKHIPPHGQLAVQVMSSSKYPNSPSPKTVILQATTSGGSSSDTAQVQ